MTPEEFDAIEWVAVTNEGRISLGPEATDESAIRADERLKVLREIRKAASDMDRNPANDPHLWGFGARNIVGMITKRLAEQRELMGIEIRKDGRHYPA